MTFLGIVGIASPAMGEASVGIGFVLAVVMMIFTAVVWSEKPPSETRKKPMSRNLPVEIGTLGSGYLDHLNRSTPLYGYHHTPLIRPDPESVLAGMDPARAADVMRDLSMDRTIREIVKGPGTEYAKMGMGTNTGSLRRRGRRHLFQSLLA